jgi:hypothetical protein
MRSPTSPLSSSDWPDHVAQQRAPLALLELGAREQDLHVGAQRRHRRAQLVRGVGHEPALRGLRGLHAVEHGVEALGHAPDLVLPARADAPPRFARGLDVLGRARELCDRADHRACEQAGHRGGEGDPPRHQQHEHDPQAPERSVDAVQRAPQLHRAQPPDRDRG